mgnify:FL=1
MNTNDIGDLKKFDIPNNARRIIKVIGVGGGGGNAVIHMYEKGIKDVTFALCNTDNQALEKSKIPVKIQLGPKTTNGLGAGNKPQRAEAAAKESISEIKEMLDDGTKMVFITAGMGGGTGTGAAPVIARTSKDMGILTVGIVTIPFIFEGEKKIIQALDGVEKLAANVDALLVINNERLREIYRSLNLINAFGKADDTLTVAAKSIAELITKEGKINVDFADVNTILKDGGVAIMSTGMGKGEDRLTKAIEDALHSPLLNNNDIYNAKKVMLNIYCSSDVKMDEINEVHQFMHNFSEEVEVIWGMTIEEELGKEIKVTILATGFGVEHLPGMTERIEERTKEEQNEELLAEEREKEEQNKKIVAVYGEAALRFRDRNKQKENHIYLFKPEDLDNEDIIAEIEATPTYDRTKSKLNIITEMSDKKVSPLLPKTDETTGKTVISFK